MTLALYERMGLPAASHLGKRVFKKLFHENAALGAADKRALREDIDTVTWEYTLKPGTLPIPPYVDEEREYLEIAVLQIDLKTRKRTARIAEVIHRAIPYPVVAVFAHESACLISLAHKRFSQAGKDAIVADRFESTGWLDLAAPGAAEEAFLDSLALDALPRTHFYALYAALVDRVTALNCARLTGAFELRNSAEQRERRRKGLDACHALERQIAECRAALKLESQFNRQVEFNLRVKALQQQLAQEAARL